MRSHGWSGNTPASDEEAIDRILNAVGSLVAEGGSSIRITDVARRLGVSRQTVYRYFPGTEALLFASRMRSADGFLDRLAAHVRGLNDPVAAFVEGVAFAVENLAGDHQLKQLMEARPGQTPLSRQPQSWHWPSVEPCSTDTTSTGSTIVSMMSDSTSWLKSVSAQYIPF